MSKNMRITSWVLTAVLLTQVSAFAIDAPQAKVFDGQDLHISGNALLIHKPSTDRHVLVFEGNFEMNIGANTFTSTDAVVWLQRIEQNYIGRSQTAYLVQVYMQGKVNYKQGKSAATTDITTAFSGGNEMISRFVVRGEVFATANTRKEGDPNGMEIFTRAANALGKIKYEPFEIEDSARGYTYPEAVVPGLETPEKAGPAQSVAKARQPWLIEEFFTPAGKSLPGDAAAEAPAAKEPKPEFQYPINIQPVGESKPQIESTTTPDGISAATIMGRFYVWQKRDEKGTMLEMQADNAVIFFRPDAVKLGSGQGSENMLATGPIKAIYLNGDVVLTESGRTIRAKEFYYDFEKHAGLAINAEMRTFDERRNIPLYVRAAKLRQISEHKFAGEKIELTNSEFYVPQFSATASSIVITDSASLGQQESKTGAAYVADLRDVRFNMGGIPVFGVPNMRTTSAKADVPIRAVHIGSDNAFGFGVETRWYLARLLGLREPEGTDSTLSVDYFAKRGLGVGAEVEYEREKYFGDMKGYIIDDHGEDRLGRIHGRKDVAPPNELRGRFAFQHRQFLAYNWQLTLETSYLSDKNFLEEFDRREYNTGKEQETLLHLKRIQDNWGLSFLAKWRINDFQDQLEELPTVEYHRTAESVFDNRMTFYSDNQLSNFRQRIGEGEDIEMSEKNYAFAMSRNELDLPLTVQTWKFVPYVAGTGGYDDRSGFKRSLVDGQDQGPAGDYATGIGELGMRGSTQFWSVYPDAKSRLFDVNQIRHLMKPYFATVGFTQTSDDVENRDTANLGLLQRWQTKRGEGDKQRTVDWMRLDTSMIVVSDPADATDSGPGPDRFIWNKPFVPLRVYSAPEIFNGDLSTINPTLTRFEQWGPRRNMFQTDYIWRTTDTLAILSDMNYDTDSGEIQQFDVGYSHLVWPNLSYYLGSRYLKRTEVLSQKGTNVFTAAVTYAIDPRYTITFAQQYDFDYEASLRSEVTLLRRYHRVYYGLSVSSDASLDTQTIMLSIWPEGVPELAAGSRRYVGVTGQTQNE